MRRAIAAAVIAVAACRKEPEPPTATATTVYEWAQQSPDKRFELRQRRDAGGCRVEAVVKPGDQVLWTSQTCLPAQSGIVFLSPNGERLLVLDLFPSTQVAQGPDWSHLPLISCWSRGAVVREYTGSEILSAARVADMRRVLSWVRGDTFEQVHGAAHASADGSQVTVELVDGRTLTLGFEGEPLGAPPADAAPNARPAARAEDERAHEPTRSSESVQPGMHAAAGRPADSAPLDEQALYRWEDDQGELHFGAGSQVPPRLRKRARPVSASVGVMPLDRTAPVQPPQPVQAQSGRPAGAPSTAAAPAASAPTGTTPEAAPNPAGATSADTAPRQAAPSATASSPPDAGAPK